MIKSSSIYKHCEIHCKFGNDDDMTGKTSNKHSLDLHFRMVKFTALGLDTIDKQYVRGEARQQA
ncbi:MAG TPA: hypothetical protein VGW09_03700, partial [Nitrososphaeraceae archaeon]|nr:hypothetical protein [Nitrososphaeraceae archaeon]